METVRINDKLSVLTDQPSADDLQRIARSGFKTIIDLRTTAEDGQPMHPDQEEAAAHTHGLDYVHLPINVSQLGEKRVDRFREVVERHPGPILVHCASGKRSGALAMLHHAAEEGLEGDQILERAEKMGFACDSDELVELVKRYADEHA